MINSARYAASKMSRKHKNKKYKNLFPDLIRTQKTVLKWNPTLTFLHQVYTYTTLKGKNQVETDKSTSENVPHALEQRTQGAISHLDHGKPIYLGKLCMCIIERKPPVVCKLNPSEILCM